MTEPTTIEGSSLAGSKPGRAAAAQFAAPSRQRGNPVAALWHRAGNREWLWGVVLVIAVFAAYQPVWRAGFIWDDGEFLVNNPLVKASDGLFRFWCTREAPDYFPMTSTMLWFEWRFWGENPLGYHVVNVLLHALSAVWLWRVLLRLKVPGAWLGAALFALHPVNVESVAWITERKNTLAMLFCLASVLAYLKAHGTRRSSLELHRGWYLAALVAFVFALLGKTAVAPLPLVLLGIAWWERGQLAWRDARRAAPFFAAAAVLGLVTIWFQSHRAIGVEAELVRADGFWSRLAGAGWALWFYLYKAALPLNLSFVYPRWEIDPTRLLSYAPGFAFGAVLLVCWWQRRRWGKAGLAAFGYFVVMLLPVLGFINIYFMRYSLVADHWQYFAIIGPLALVAAIVHGGGGRHSAGHTAGASSPAEKPPENAGAMQTDPGCSGRQDAGPLRQAECLPPLRMALAAALLLALGILTCRQCATYANSEILWRTTLARNPGCPIAHINLGNILTQKTDLSQAKAHFQKALEWKLDYATAAVAHYNLGDVSVKEGRLDDAAVHLQKALEINPDFGNARYNLASVYLKAGRLDEAIVLLETYLEAEPRDVEARYSLGNALLEKGQVPRAIAQYQTALNLQPDNLNVCQKLAWVLATCPDGAIRNGVMAVDLAERAVELARGTDLTAFGTLAAAYAEAGRFPDAVAAAGQALRMAQAQGNAPLAAAIRKRIELYQSGAAYRDRKINASKSEQ